MGHGGSAEQGWIDLDRMGESARVVVVDDSESIRRLLALTFRTDDRFELVASGESGEEAVELAREHRPDVLVIDRMMPGMGGLAALREVRRCCPETAIVLYTATADGGTRQAAGSAGALAVVDKQTVTVDLADVIARALVRHWAEHGATVEVVVGPVSSAAARMWVDNTRRILMALRARPEVLDPPVPEDVLDSFGRFVSDWADQAEVTDEFLWVGRAPVDDVRRLVEHWARVDSMTDEQLEQLGCSWSPPEARPFFVALTQGALRALEAHERTAELCARLSRQWDDVLKP
ncbi:MAG TPA: response regulator [Acidimicrobiales bacterium]|nr:response regulator [Acidimicrobiales bacterium]